MGAGGAAASDNAENSLGCLRLRNHCPPTDDFVQLLCQSSLPASKDACAAFPCTSPKSPGGGCAAVLARRFVPRVPWKGRVEYWMYFQALYRVLWGKSLSQNQCFLIWRQPNGWRTAPAVFYTYSSCSRRLSSGESPGAAARPTKARHWAGDWPVSFLNTRHR